MLQVHDLLTLDDLLIRHAELFASWKEFEIMLQVMGRVNGELIDNYDSPFSRDQSKLITHVIASLGTLAAQVRLTTKPTWFKLLTGTIEKATRGSAAFDLFATEDVLVGDTPVAVPTGVRTEFDPRLVAIIKEKSGLSVNKKTVVTIPKNETTPSGAIISRNHTSEREAVIAQGLEVKAGVIDSDYRDEWKVVLRRPIQEKTLFDWFEAELRNRHGTSPIKPESFQVKAGMKIAQVILVELPTVAFSGEGVIFKDQIRQGGFGSTGTGTKAS